MKIDKWKLINEDRKIGVWVREDHLLDLIKITYKRNAFYHKKLILWYEDLSGKTFNYDLINK